jgi:hypothetical protein
MGRARFERIAGCGERERQWLRFMRWRYLRGRLTEFPQRG